MRRLVPLLAALALLAWAANLKLYLKDGTYSWCANIWCRRIASATTASNAAIGEEIPLDLVNLERTRTEAAEHQAEVEKQAKILSEEDKAERAIQDEAMKIPQDPGVYWVDGGKNQYHQAGR